MVKFKMILNGLPAVISVCISLLAISSPFIKTPVFSAVFFQALPLPDLQPANYSIKGLHLQERFCKNPLYYKKIPHTFFRQSRYPASRQLSSKSRSVLPIFSPFR